MSNAQKALVMAAGIFLAIALITIAVVMFISAQEATKSAQESFSGIQNDLSSTAFNVYDGTTVSGSQVVNALNKYKGRDQFGILVRTGRNQANSAIGTWYGFAVDDAGVVGSVSTGTMTDATTASKDSYVNPSGRFSATIIRDASNVVHAIKFIQK